MGDYLMVVPVAPLEVVYFMRYNQLGLHLSEVRLFCLLLSDFYDTFAKEADKIISNAVYLLLLLMGGGLQILDTFSNSG